MLQRDALGRLEPSRWPTTSGEESRPPCRYRTAACTSPGSSRTSMLQSRCHPCRRLVRAQLLPEDTAHPRPRLTVSGCASPETAHTPDRPYRPDVPGSARTFFRRR